MIPLLLVCLFFPVLRHHKAFTVSGTSPYCTIDYRSKEINCIYKTRYACMNTLHPDEAIICYPNRFTKKKS